MCSLLRSGTRVNRTRLLSKDGLSSLEQYTSNRQLPTYLISTHQCVSLMSIQYSATLPTTRMLFEHQRRMKCIFVLPSILLLFTSILHTVHCTNRFIVPPPPDNQPNPVYEIGTNLEIEWELETPHLYRKIYLCRTEHECYIGRYYDKSSW